MMKLFHHPQCNESLGKPADWDEDRDGICETLPIIREGNVMHSFWQPSFMDRLRILFGAKLRLSVFGRQHPPVAIEVAEEHYYELDSWF